MHDRLGSVRQIFDTEGSVVNYYFYDPWGNLDTAISNSTVTNIYRFAGYAEDAVLGQYHCNARQYDPILGVFTAIDPVRGGFQEPLTLHPYLYCINDPINFVDLNGCEYGAGPWWLQGEFWGELWSEIVKGAAAATDGWIPIFDPFEDVYANPDGSIDRVYQTSRILAVISREATFAIINSWALQRILPATKSLTLAEQLFASAVWKGELVKTAFQGSAHGVTLISSYLLIEVFCYGDTFWEFISYL